MSSLYHKAIGMRVKEILVVAFFAAIANVVASSSVVAETLHGVDLNHGDLIFLRGTEDIVFYQDSQVAAPEDLWEEARANILAEDERAATIETWSYADFLRHFGEGVDDPTSVRAMGGTLPISVGHVAIFFRDQEGLPFIFEAAGAAEGVQRVAWQKWKKHNVVGSDVWIARLTFSEKEIGEVVAEALKHDKAPYDITNRDLTDASAFYCSKLVWLAVKDATGVAMDGNQNGNRFLWYSPLQLLNSEFLDVVASSTDEPFSGLE